MSEKALENAQALRDRLAKERNDLAQRSDELRRQVARLDQFIADYGAFEQGQFYSDGSIAGGAEPESSGARVGCNSAFNSRLVQIRRRTEIARQLEADETEKAFDEAVSKIMPFPTRAPDDKLRR